MGNIFDRMEDALSDFAGSISSSAKEFTEVSSLKGQIHSQEKLIEKTYLEIGKKYYEAHKNDTADAFLDQIQTIQDAKKKINELRVDIENLQSK